MMVKSHMPTSARRLLVQPTMLLRSFAISAALALVTVGCTGSPDDDLSFETDGGKQDGVARPYGTWERTPALPDGELGFSKLTLNEDRTFAITTHLGECEAGECSRETVGKYRYATSHDRRYIVLYENDGTWFESFEYRYDGDSLDLTLRGFNDWWTMAPGVDGLVLTEADNNGTFEVTEGDDVVVNLEATPSTGYNWAVTATDRTFGYPDESYSDDGTIGAKGLMTFTWKTSGALSVVGEHSVTLGYRRSWENVPPLETFEFTVNVVAK
jgi:predicted secreted protein